MLLSLAAGVWHLRVTLELGVWAQLFATGLTLSCQLSQKLLEEMAKKQLVALISTGSYELAVFSTTPKPGTPLRPGFLLLPRG